MSVGNRTNPYLDFRFVVEIDSVIAGGFTEVTGLERELETEEYDEGGVNTHTHSLEAGFTHPNLVLRRGLTDSDTLWQWLKQSDEEAVERKTVLLFLLNSTGKPSWGWSFSRAYPVKWTGPEFRADSGDVAIESLELTHTGISKVEGV